MTAFDRNFVVPVAPGRFLSTADVEHETSLNRTTIWRRVKKGTFPSPHPIGGGRVCWLQREVEDWKAQILASPPQD